MIRASSKYKGVCWNKKDKKWIARVTINSERKYLGRFLTEEEAYLAIKKELRMNGDGIILRERGLKVDDESVGSE